MKRIVLRPYWQCKIGIITCLLCVFGAAVAQTPVDKTYPAAVVQRDFRFMRHAMEEAHPGLYRYQSKDSISHWFDQTERQLDHPMNEREIRRTILPLLARIGCGHTNLVASETYEKYLKKHKQANFPVEAVTYQNRLFVFSNRSADSTLRKGLEILAIDGQPVATVLTTLYSLMTSDGYNRTFQPWAVNAAGFSNYYRYGYGTRPTYVLTVSDSIGKSRTMTVRGINPDSVVVKRPKAIRPDSALRRTVAKATPVKTPTLFGNKKVSLQFVGPDSAVAVLHLTTFSGMGFRRQYRQLFRRVRERGSRSMILDLRGNTGGSSAMSLKLASYFVDTAFVGYRQVDAPVRQVSFNQQLGYKFWRFFMRNIFSRRTELGTYRRLSGEKVWHPTRLNHFGGDVYVLTNGGTFSAASICASLVRNLRPNVTIIGRESGGGRNGCNAYTTPYLTLPETALRLRFPLYKLVLNIAPPDEGHGVIPDVPVTYSPREGLSGRDLDIAKALALIKTKS